MIAAAVLSIGLVGCTSSSIAPLESPTPTPGRPGPAMVQVENSMLARPLAGIQQADIVFEYLAEGGITRMTVIYFQPSGSHRIEPVRSARPVTVRLWRAYHGVIFFSGAHSRVLQSMRDQNVPALTEGSEGGIYFARDQNRFAPHNLYTTGDQLLEGILKYAPRVTYRLPAPGNPTVSPSPGSANRVAFDQTSSHRVTYTYSAADGAYIYGTELGPLMDNDTGRPIEPVNVIVIQVAHHDAGFTDVLGAPVVDFDLVGAGAADVFSGGRRYSATWSLLNPDEPLEILDAGAKIMHLPAGLTWIHLVDPGTPISVS